MLNRILFVAAMLVWAGTAHAQCPGGVCESPRRTINVAVAAPTAPVVRGSGVVTASPREGVDRRVVGRPLRVLGIFRRR